VSALDEAIAALSAQMSASLLIMSQDGATGTLLPHAEALVELVSDLALAVADSGTPPTYTGWAPASAGVPDYPPPGLL
jgi:hypothetical protein